MRAVTWQGRRKMEISEVPDPVIQDATDIIIKVTSSGICGSDLHLYEVMAPFMSEGDIVGHEPMGIVQEVGSAVKNIQVGDRVVIPFNISCGHCTMCLSGLQSQCDTTQVREHNRGAAFFGYSKLYGQVPGGQAEYLRVPHGDYGAVKVPNESSDDRFLYLSDVLPTAWQGVKYANIPDGGSVLIIGQGPIGHMAARVAKLQGAGQVIVTDVVPERLERAQRLGFQIVDSRTLNDEQFQEAIRDLTGGRGVDAVIEAVGMEAHGSPSAKLSHDLSAVLPSKLAESMINNAGVDRMNALYHAIDAVRRGGTISISGVYAGKVDPMPLDTLFDKQIQLRMGQANVRRWTDEILPYLTGSDDPLGVDEFATHHLPLEDAPMAYEIFQKKEDGAFKIILQP